MLILAAISTAAVLAALGLIHVYWAAGGALGGAVSVPERNGEALFHPGRAATLVVAFLLFSASAVLLARAGFWGTWLPKQPLAWGAWTLTAVFLLRAIGDFRWVGFFKRVRGTAFARWDSRLFSPLCLLLALGCMVVSMKAATVPELERMIARFAPTELRVDISGLSGGDRQALGKLIEAGRVIDRIFLSQLWSGNLALYEKLKADHTPLGKAGCVTSRSTKVRGPISTSTARFSMAYRPESRRARTSIPKT